MADDKCTAVPLVEQLRSVPRDAKLRIDTPNALGCTDTLSIPVGRMCHEAADALGVDVPVAPKRWPFVETPGEFTQRLHAALGLFDNNLLAAVRYVLIETPPTLAAGVTGTQGDQHG